MNSVVIAIIAILVAFLLPAVQQAREAARRSSCKNNLKQFGLALHNYHDTHRVFPPGQLRGWVDQPSGTPDQEFGNGFSWGAMLLPFIEQGALYDSLNFSVGIKEAPNEAIIESLGAIPTALCPSDSDRPKTRSLNTLSSAPSTSYFGTVGAFNNWSDSTNPRLAGGFFTTDPAKPSTMASIKDGTTNTIAIGEGSYSVWTGGVFLGANHNTKVLGDDDYASNQDWWLHWGVYPISNASTGANDNVRFSSKHKGGAQFLMADGSVRFISENVDHILEQTGLDTNHTAARGAGCLWRSDAGGCSDGGSGAFRNKTALASLMGVWQRLHHKNDGLVIGEF